MFAAKLTMLGLSVIAGHRGHQHSQVNQVPQSEDYFKQSLDDMEAHF